MGLSGLSVYQIIVYTVLLPISILGIILNLVVLIGYHQCRHALGLKASRLNQLMRSLTIQCLILSLMRGSGIIAALIDKEATRWLWLDGERSTSIILYEILFLTHLLLSLERLFIIHPFRERIKNMAVYTAWGGCLAVILSTVIWTVYESTMPEETRKYFVTTLHLRFYGIVVGAVMGGVYYFAYKYSTMILESVATLAQSEEEQTEFKILTERRLLRGCVLMCGSLFVCYVPWGIGGIVLLTSGRDAMPSWLDGIGSILFASDMVLNPIFVLSLTPVLKTWFMFWRT
ncbi:hypothetical protein BDR26DRAFT_227471 [Obelidium mucronatum]|nr:hypothetical protein BDR26DRAFT_227471 [Obelidium mucronatum]